MTCSHHDSGMQNSSIALKFLCVVSVYSLCICNLFIPPSPQAPGNHWSFYRLHNFAFHSSVEFLVVICPTCAVPFQMATGCLESLLNRQLALLGQLERWWHIWEWLAYRWNLSGGAGKKNGERGGNAECQALGPSNTESLGRGGGGEQRSLRRSSAWGWGSIQDTLRMSFIWVEPFWGFVFCALSVRYRVLHREQLQEGCFSVGSVGEWYAFRTPLSGPDFLDVRGWSDQLASPPNRVEGWSDSASVATVLLLKFRGGRWTSMCLRGSIRFSEWSTACVSRQDGLGSRCVEQVQSPGHISISKLPFFFYKMNLPRVVFVGFVLVIGGYLIYKIISFRKTSIA